MEMSAEITRTRPVLAALRAFRLAFVAMMEDEDGPSKELREAFEDSENKLLEALSQYEAAGPDPCSRCNCRGSSRAPGSCARPRSQR